LRAREFLIEYNKQKTAQQFGSQLFKAFSTGPDKSQLSAAAPNEETREQDAINYVLSQFEEADPTPNKIYTPWIAREYAKGNIKRIEDALAWLPAKLRVYDKAKKRQDFRADAKDIMRLSYTQFLTIMDSYQPPQEQSSNKGEAEQIFKSENVRVIIPKNEPAACYYGRGTRWCTAATDSTNYFSLYSNQGPLYILLPQKPTHDGEKYQLHFESGQFMEESDDQVSLGWLLKERFPELEEFFVKNQPMLKEQISFADTRELENAGDKIRELIMQHTYEKVWEWESEDDYYRSWQREEAESRGLIDPETMDADEIDEIIANTDDLNDYLDYNDEARRLVGYVKDALPMSATDIKYVMNEVIGEELSVNQLEDIYSTAIEHELYGDYKHTAKEISLWIGRHILVRADKDGNIKVKEV
jgi:hypothetical protein